MTLLKPPAVSPNASIGVICPSGPANSDHLENGIRYLEGRGYRVVVGEHVFDSRGYLAGKDEDRAADINRMFSDPMVNAVFCARGGYGSGRLLKLLDYGLIRSNPKSLVGLSDATALQLAILASSGLVTFSGFVLGWDLRNGQPDPFTEGSLWSAVTSTEPVELRPPADAVVRTLRGGCAKGPLIPACLSLLCSLVGTRYLPPLRGVILLVEDLAEAPYRIDRMLNQLLLAGILEGLAGLVLGEFKACFTPEEMEHSLSLEEMVVDLTRGLDIPILTGFPYGHFDRRLVLPIGVPAEIDANEGVLRLLEGAVTI